MQSSCQLCLPGMDYLRCAHWAMNYVLTKSPTYIVLMINLAWCLPPNWTLFARAQANVAHNGLQRRIGLVKVNNLGRDQDRNGTTDAANRRAHSILSPLLWPAAAHLAISAGQEE